MEDTNNQDDNIDINNDDGTIDESSDIEEEDSKLHPQVRLDNNILQRLKQNDSSITITSLDIQLNCPFFNSIDWKEDGDFISNNTQLKTILITHNGRCLDRDWGEPYILGEQGDGLPTRQQLLDFFSCIHQNRSIKELVTRSIEVDEFGGGLIEGLKGHPSLTKLESGKIGSIACTAVGKVLNHPASKLENLIISGNLDDERFGILCDALLGNSTLKKIDLNLKRDITSVGWKKLSTVLRHPSCKLVDLGLYNAGLNDEGTNILGKAFSSTSIKSLDLGFNESILSARWQALFNQLSQTSITHLNICENRIDDMALAVLASISTLKSLDLSFNGEITPSGWRSFFNLLQTRGTQLKNLFISSNNVGDESIAALGSLLSSMPSLKTLGLNDVSDRTLDHSNNITTQGWQTLFTTLQDSNLDLADLNLSINSIDDEGIQLLVRLVSSMTSLKCMNLSCNRPVTPSGWQVLTGYLQSPNCRALETLDLDNCKINDDTLIAYMRTLAQNNTLKRLTLYECTDDDDNHLITERGWEALSSLLCNKSSIMDTYNSNHTLCDVCDDFVEEDLSDDLVSLLKLNKNKNKAEVARQKILQTHFSGSDTTSKMQVLLGMELEMMPAAIEWIGRGDVYGLSTMYNLMRRLPELFDSSAQKKKSTAAKRKRIA